METPPKYKVGDKVRLTTDINLLDRNRVSSLMAGKVVEIERYTGWNNFENLGQTYITTCGWRILEFQIVPNTLKKRMEGLI